MHQALAYSLVTVLGYGMSVVLNGVKKDIFMGAVSTIFAATTTTKSGEYICREFGTLLQVKCAYMCAFANAAPAIPEAGSELAQDGDLGERLMKLARSVVNDATKASEQGCPMMDH